MNKKLFNVLLFATGAAIGSLVTWKVLETKYEHLIQEEVDKFKEDYAKCMGESSTESGTPDSEYDADEELGCESEDDTFDDDDMADYHSLAGKYGGSREDSENGGEGEGEDVPYIDGPYVIEPGDFGDGNYDHDLYSLTYYADGVLANDWDETLDIDETIGEEALEHFGEYTDEDVVHVRNKRLNADYEVVRDHRTYTEVLAINSPTRGYAD